jgi:serine/threonine protein phosphatase PrpC
MIQDKAIWEIVDQASDVEAATAKLIDTAMANGGEDNITVVIVAFEPE